MVFVSAQLMWNSIHLSKLSLVSSFHDSACGPTSTPISDASIVNLVTIFVHCILFLKAGDVPPRPLDSLAPLPCISVISDFMHSLQP